MTWKTPRIQKNGEGVARGGGLTWILEATQATFEGVARAGGLGDGSRRSSHKAIAHRIFPEIPFHNS